jgi:hypothetical protein
MWRPHVAHVELERVGEDRVRGLGVAPHALRLGIGLDDGAKPGFAQSMETEFKKAADIAKRYPVEGANFDIRRPCRARACR